MEFSTDTNWPEGLTTIFKISRQQNVPFEYRYYGPYDKLLNYCFGNSFKYFIAPQHAPGENSRDSVDFLAFLVVFNQEHKPVLIAEIKDDSWKAQADTRLRADEQIRRRYDQMLGKCPIPNLYALSLLGTSVRVYRGDVATGDIEPEFQPRPNPNRILPPTFLEGHWNLDILSEEGFMKMKEIISYILAESAKVVGQ